MIVMDDESRLTPTLYRRILVLEGADNWIIEGIKYIVIDGEGYVNAGSYRLRFSCGKDHLKVMKGTIWTPNQGVTAC
jgi:hypothetical protein